MTVRLFAPIAAGPHLGLPLRDRFPADGWSAETIASHAQGGDALHALQLAMQKIGVDLSMTSYHREGNLRWHDWVGHGFAVGRSAHDLLRGDDAVFYG